MAANKTTPKTTKTPAVRKPAARRKRTPAASYEAIATRAYYLHLEGGPDPLDNWLRAERELAAA